LRNKFRDINLRDSRNVIGEGSGMLTSEEVGKERSYKNKPNNNKGKNSSRNNESNNSKPSYDGNRSHGGKRSAKPSGSEMNKFDRLNKQLAPFGRDMKDIVSEWNAHQEKGLDTDVRSAAEYAQKLLQSLKKNSKGAK
jgi:hypothetical protein